MNVDENEGTYLRLRAPDFQRVADAMRQLTIARPEFAASAHQAQEAYTGVVARGSQLPAQPLVGFGFMSRDEFSNMCGAQAQADMARLKPIGG